jgi:hypothetical protein
LGKLLIKFDAELDLILRARYPIIYVTGAEEERAEIAITQVAKGLGRNVYIWDFVDGYQGNVTRSRH